MSGGESLFNLYDNEVEGDDGLGFALGGAAVGAFGLAVAGIVWLLTSSPTQATYRVAKARTLMWAKG